MIKYATIKRGKVKLAIGSQQDKFLHYKKFPHSHIQLLHGIKTIKRYDTIHDKISKNDNQLYLDPRTVKASKSGLKSEGFTEKGKSIVDQKLLSETTTSGAYISPIAYPKKTFIGGGLRDIDFNNPQNIKYLSNILRHEEMHQAIFDIHPKDKGMIATRKYDSIVIPTIQQYTEHGKHVLNPYSALAEDPKAIKGLKHTTLAEDKLTISANEQKYVDEDTKNLKSEWKRLSGDTISNNFTSNRMRKEKDITAAQRFGTQNIKQLPKIGEGRDRLVYQLDNDKVLKVAKNPQGIEQNRYESDLEYLGQLKHYETGKDYVVMERAEKPGPTTTKFLQPFKKFTQKDFEEKTSPLQKTFNKADMGDLLNYDVGYKDFITKRNWGEKAGKPVLVDAGTLNIESLDKHIPRNAPSWKQVKEGNIPKDTEWREIQQERRQYRDKGVKLDDTSGNRKLSESPYVTLYHGTTTKHAKNILSEGLIPPTGQNPVWYSDKGGKTFLATTPSRALGYAIHGPERMREGKYNRKTFTPTIPPEPYTPTLLKVTIPKSMLNETKGLFYGPTREQDFENLEELNKYNKEWKDPESTEKDIFESSSSFGEFTTNKTIPPKYIKEIPLDEAKSLVAKKSKQDATTTMGSINRDIERLSSPYEHERSSVKVPRLTGTGAPSIDYTWNKKTYMHEPYPKATEANIPIPTDDTSENMAWAKGLDAEYAHGEGISFATGKTDKRTGEYTNRGYEKKRVLMSPDDVLYRQFEQKPRTQPELTNPKTYDERFDKWKRFIDRENIDKLKRAIQDPKAQVPVVIEEYDETGKRKDFQEGRHRAIAAKELGHETMPVILALKRPDADYPEYSKKKVSNTTAWDVTNEQYPVDKDNLSEDMVKVYHGTDKLKSYFINKEGIKSSKTLKSESKYASPEQSEKTDPSKTYYFDNPKHALSWAKVVGEQSGVQPTVIEADIPAKHLKPDYNMKYGKAYSYKGDVPAHKVRELREDEISEDRMPDIKYCKKCGKLDPITEEEYQYAEKQNNRCKCGVIATVKL